MFDILEIFDSHPAKINILDVGAMDIGQAVYTPLLEKNLAQVIGFEPQQKECDKLNKTHEGRHKFLPYALSDGTEQDFYETIAPMCSSLFEPDLEMSEKFNNYAHLKQVVSKSRIKTHKLDDIKEVKDNIDYIKVDAQGAECQIFENANKALKSAVIIETEMLLLPTYKNVPLFSDIDIILRKHGFLFHKFLGLYGRHLKPFKDAGSSVTRASQMMWTDGLYVKNFMEFDQLSPEKLISLAIVLHQIYESFDLCHLSLESHDKLTGSHLAEKYRNLFMQKK